MIYREDTAHVESEEVVHKRERSLRILQGLLIVALFLSFAKLYSGPMPWGKTVVQRIEQKAPEIENPKSVTSFGHWLHSEVEHPKLLRAKEHGIIGTWYASAFTLGAAFLLLISAPVWMPRGQREGLELTTEDDAGAEAAGEEGFAKVMAIGPLFYALVIGALVAGVWFRVPAMGHSLWNDEEYAMRRFALGEVNEKGAFEPVNWTDTLYENHNGNNHLLHSALSRVSLSLWHLFNKSAEPQAFNETAVRMPSLIAGVLAIALIAVIGWEMGSPWAGIGAAWLLALHPWHIRYSAEAKGYALCVFFVCVAVLGLIRALRHNRLSGWLLFAFGEAAFLLSFAGSLYVAIALNVIALFECLLRRQPRHLAALVAFNLLAAMPVVLWILPSVPQVLGFIQQDKMHLEADSGWISDLGSHVITGFQHHNAEPENHTGTSWALLTEAHPLVMQIAFWVLLVLGIGGLVMAALDSIASRIAIVAPTLAGGLGFWHASVQHHPNLAMYYIYLLIPLTLALSFVLVRFKTAHGYLLALFVVGFAFITQTPRAAFIEHDRQPIRETVAAIREKRPEALTGTFGVGDKQVQSYDPGVRFLEKPADVDKLIADGTEQGRPVFIYVAGNTESQRREPELMKRVADSSDFVVFEKFKGHEAMWSYTIYRPAAQR